MSKSGRTEQFTPVSGEQNEEVIKDYVSDCGDIIGAYKLFTVILIKENSFVTNTIDSTKV